MNTTLIASIKKNAKLESSGLSQTSQYICWGLSRFRYRMSVGETLTKVMAV